MAVTFLKAKGYGISDSLLDRRRNVSFAKDLMDKAEAKGVKLLIPVDTVVAKEFAADAENKVVPATRSRTAGRGGYWAEPQTVWEAIKGAKTVVWNRPMGVFEFEAFANGTKAV